MPSIINLDDGQISGTPAIRITAAGDGVLEIQNSGNPALEVSATGEIFAVQAIRASSIKSPAGNPAISISQSGIATFVEPPLTAIPLFAGSNNIAITSSVYVLSDLTPNLDTHGWFTTSNNRYTPEIAGYYRTNHLMTGTSATSSVGAIIVVARRNGSNLQARVYRTPAATNMSGYVESIVYMNGTTDYFDWQAWVGATSPTVQSYVSVQLVRAGPE